ncbi:hypothetical protein [Microbulbifer taiwanensis]|uniref:Peptidase M15A C-terminal domain-containing protein n=1 Tax=Microbulbifer taiwanensis TaxID=986746 RepID=A0ABW1YFV8_9GAMM|nr:hypothetical protein [Microbulbifer taiwanensis]
MTRPTLTHFKPSEFGIWYPLMNAELLQKLDAFRAAWGGRVIISPAEGGIGRHGGEGGTSQHNVDRWGEVRAIDVFPQVQDPAGNWRYLDNGAQLEHAYQVAEQVGFTGIGVYTDTSPGHMVHLDVRPRKPDGGIATWSRVNHQYLGLQSGFA